MNYYLFFENGSRVYNLKMADDPEERKPIKILMPNSDAGAELITLKTNDLKLISVQGTDSDIEVHIERYQIDGNSLNIYLSEDSVMKFGDKTEKPFRFVKNNRAELEIRNVGSNNHETYNISFYYNENIVGEINVDCVPGNQIYNMVLDFGSEASQMLITQRDADEQSELFYNCVKHFYGIAPTTIKERTYDQQEDNDRHLFRSIFFLPQEGREKEDCDPVIAKPGVNDPLFDFITKRNDAKGQRLPNIKISSLSGKRSQGIDPKTQHISIVVRFIHEAIMEINERERLQQKEEEGAIAIRIYLLVPNVMDQVGLSEFIQAIQANTDKEDFRDLLPAPMKDVIIDIQPYSESDASFIYWQERPENPIEEGTYLIIDVGKGTTDFSIVKVEDGQNAISIYRSGFVGAGNAITYAMFENYICTMAGELDAREIIKKVLTDASDAELYSLENILESYKRSLKPINTAPSTINIAMDVEAIINAIEGAGTIDDNRGIILAALHDIIEKIVVNVKATKFDKVILSGRAFKYEPFEQETKKILSKLYNLEDERIVTIDRPKEGCLRGPLSTMKINKQSNIIGIPVKVDRSEEIAETRKLQQDMQDIIKEELENNKIVPTDKKEGLLKRMWNYTCYRIKCIYRKFTRKKYGKVDNQLIHLMAESEDIIKIMRGDKDTGECDANTRFYISDDNYVAEGDLIEKGKLFFDGTDFYIRAEKTGQKLVKTADTPNRDMLYESLFPYPYRILDKDYDIPEIKMIKG